MTAADRAEYERLLATAKVEATLRNDERLLDELQLYELDQLERSTSWYDYRLNELRAGLEWRLTYRLV